MSTLETLEHHEHASHAAEHGNRHAALLLAVLGLTEPSLAAF